MRTIRAAVVRDFAQGPRYDTVEVPDGDGPIVDVLAAALSPRARSGASGTHYTSDQVLPLVPGIDGVGRLADGRRVYFVGDGAMAAQARVHERLTVLLPETAAATAIAAGMLPAISSWVALTKRAPLQPGQRVLVVGATGTSGLLAVQIAKRLGAGEVVAAGRNADALARATQLGADRAVALDAAADVAAEVDIVLDYLWGDVTSKLMPALCRARKGESRALRWVLIGSVAGDEIGLSSVLLRKRNLHVLGSGQGASSVEEMFSVAPAIVNAFAANELVVAHRDVPLADIADWWTASGERIVFVP